MVIYVISSNGDISQEAYDTYEKALDFIKSRSDVDPEKVAQGSFYFAAKNNRTYMIHMVRVI